MKKMLVIGAVLAMSAGSGFAQSGGISVPGLGKADGSAGSKVSGSTIAVSGNKSGSVTVGGGELSVMKLGNVEMTAIANVNSVNVTGSEIKNSKLLVTDNESKEVNAIGGTANVNSININ